MRRRRHVAIVGGGFSGVALAAQLLRGGDGTLRATLLESGTRLGRGLAYATTNPAHLLNTRAERMSLFADDPAHFVRWARSRCRGISPTTFAARSVYGDYLEETLHTLAADVGPATFSALPQAEVADIGPLTSGFAVELGGGAVLHADEVVLATGHPLPADPLARWLPAGEPRYVRDPWRTADRLEPIARDDRVLLLGTGLTMVDVALTLARNGHRGGIAAVSRRGLLPRVHGAAHQELPRDIAAELRSGLRLGNLRRAVRAVRSAAAAAEERGLHWQTVIDALRASTEPFWGALCAADRRHFVHRLRPYWDVHRHRLPPVTAKRFAELRDRGQLRVSAGHVAARWEGNTLVVDVHNNNGKARLARTGEFASENVAIEERYVFAGDGERYVYEATYSDPTIYTRPWTITIPAKKYTVDSQPDDWHYQTFDAVHSGSERIVEAYERTCVENNAGHGEIAIVDVQTK